MFLLQRCANLCSFHVTDGQNMHYQITRGKRSKRTRSNCILCLLFILSGSPNECWLRTCDACILTTWRLGLRPLLSPVIKAHVFPLPSVGAKPLGPLGLNPFIAHSSIISCFSLSVGTSSFCCLAILFVSFFVCLVLLLFFVCTAWFFGLLENTFPHLLAATFGKHKNQYQSTITIS